MYKLVLYSTTYRPLTLGYYDTLEQAQTAKRNEWLSCMNMGWRGRVKQIRIKKAGVR